MTDPAIRDAIVAAYGRESAAALAARYGKTKNAVIGIWFRHVPPEQRAEMLRSPARKAVMAAASARKALARRAATLETAIGAPASTLPASPPKRVRTRKARPRRERKKAPPMELPALQMEPAREPFAEIGVGLIDLLPEHCRFPIGNGRAIRYCGAPRLRKPGMFSDGCSPYCEEHTRLCYVPLEARQERKRKRKRKQKDAARRRPHDIAWGWL